ncbi:MAG TPA: cytochrome c [Pyrinomonadaceae bacterium]|nr:cytochrome c [Pyrinomonadaceae bacterium]
MKLTSILQRIGLATAAAAIFTAVLIAVPTAGATQEPTDPAAYYKAKCFACHGAKAEKKFDATLPEEQMVEAILKGKKAEKPPNMPSFEAKGVTADQAKALAGYMKHLKETPAGN